MLRICGYIIVLVSMDISMWRIQRYGIPQIIIIDHHEMIHKQRPDLIASFFLALSLSSLGVTSRCACPFGGTLLYKRVQESTHVIL